MENFREKILTNINTPVERISFRKDKWGDLCTVYFANAFLSCSIGNDCDKDEFDCFIETVKQGSRSFIVKAEECYGKDWIKYVKHRK